MLPQDTFARFSIEELKALERGMALLRSARYLAAHEVLEDAWRRSDGVAHTLFHGLAQLAASYHQLALGRGRAAVRTWVRARAKLERAGLATSVLATQVEALHAHFGLSEETPRFFEPTGLDAHAQPSLRALASALGIP